MRIAVSGTHCSGKTTLVEDFLRAHPGYAHEPEPYEWLEASFNIEPDFDDFQRQLELSVERLRSFPPGAKVIAERSPLDFIAYMRALGARDVDAAMELARSGMEHVDLLVILPLDPSIDMPDEENPELRESMNEQLLELVATGSIVDGDRTRVVEIGGTPRQRLEQLERHTR